MTDTKTEQEPFSVSVKHTITQERLEDLLCCAFEGGIGYWAMIKYVEPVAGADYAHQFPARGGHLILADSTGEGWPECDPTLDGKAVREGLQTMADKYPKHMADFMAENDDAITGDVFVQCCIFGEVVFG